MSSALFDRGKLVIPVLLVGFIPFLISASYTWSELSYSMWSSVSSEVQLAEASEFEMKILGIPLAKQWEIGYHFRDRAGELIRSRDVTPVDWEPPADMVKVQYFPGTDDSRLVGNRYFGSVVFFFVYLSAAIATCVVVWRFASQQVNAPRHRRR